jgi:hypothetical protein
MYKIRMLKDCDGYEDGFTCKLYKKGQEYNIGASLFKSFRNMGFCELVLEETVQEPVAENKVVLPVAETTKVKVKAKKPFKKKTAKSKK